MKRFLQFISYNKTPLLLSLILIAEIAGTQAQCPQRYTDYVFDEVKITPNINYGGNKRNTDGTYTRLAFDLYEPKDDTAKSRPLIIYMHGGGYTNFPPISRNSPEIIELGVDLAKRGYVVISPSYRLFSGETTYKKMVETVIAATVDINDLICQLGTSVSNGNKYRIDTSKVILGGSSAGGTLALNFGLFLKDTAELDARIREAARVVQQNDGINIQEILGNKFCGLQPIGIISTSAGFIDTNLIKPTTGSVLAIHGTADFAIPYTQGNALGMTELPIIYGPAVFGPIMDRKGIEYIPEIYEGQGHVPMVLPFGENIWKAIRKLLNTLSPINKPIMKIAKETIAGFCYSVIGSPLTDCIVSNTGQSIHSGKLNLFPNPTNGRFNLEIPNTVSKGNENKTLLIFDVKGKEIFRMQNVTDNITSIDISGNAPGLYLLGLNSGNEVYIERFILH